MACAILLFLHEWASLISHLSICKSVSPDLPVIEKILESYSVAQSRL
ncbi:hypothetical protein cce_3167 [Crocosphaera subtropica ATCC 51142]|uniref:Uncharacterized protein n=1 Tax=Crocosphaera subtropica (strain ATCC 51142 / BH68) TaxID=43989 RepID=B1WXH4_CROS5|nr:hypothetical protein cce_3167 [Crocosphaera subtropica ATCC 51142]